MVAIKTKVFVSVSNVVQPNKRVWAIKESGYSHILQSMLFKVIRMTCLSLSNLRQWRRKWDIDSIPEPQLKSGF